jgi:hypothetical protein
MSDACNLTPNAAGQKSAADRSAGSAARPRTSTTGSQNRPPSSFLWPSGTKAAPCRFTAQGAKAAAGPLVETLTGRLYHDAGEAKFQKEEQKGSLV